MTLTEGQILQLERHFQLLQRWNRALNLTALKSLKEMCMRHFSEALFLARALKRERGSLVDIGSGAGFPGFPLAVVLPAFNVTLVESNRRKAVFLKELAREQSNVAVFSGRFEELNGRFDWATIRGVSVGRLLEDIRKKTDNLALLTGDEEARKLSACNLWENSQLVTLPWGKTMLVLARVPRET